MLKVYELSINGSADYVATGDAAPLTSWKIKSDQRNVIQSGYEIQRSKGSLFTSPESTGEVVSDLVYDRAWVGAPLTSREVTFLRVRVKVANGWSEWSLPLRVEASLLKRGDWQAKLITLPGDDGTRGSTPTHRYQKDFTVDSVDPSARLHITAQGLFNVSINGEEISDHLLMPGWTSYNKRLSTVTYDISQYLVPGKNQIVAEVADGWFRGYLGWEKERNLFGSQIGLFAQVEQEKKVITATDSSWRVTSTECLEADIYNGTTIDYRIAASNGKSAKEIESSFGTLSHISSPPVRITETLNPKFVSTTPAGDTLIDFGQNLSGWLKITFNSAVGEEVSVRHAEVVNLDGSLNTALLRSARATDHYILPGGIKTVEPRFTFHGFRYAEIVTTAEIIKVEAVAINSDVRKIGFFECSDLNLNKLISNISWSIRDNFVSVPTDCPQRDERLGWTGDVQAITPAASTLFDSRQFFQNWLVDVTLDQLESGAVTNFVPHIVPKGFSDLNMQGGKAGWADVITIMPWAMYEAYGDLKVLTQTIPAMKRWVGFLQNLVVDGLIQEPGFQFGDWLDPDAPNSQPWAAKCDALYLFNSYFANSARILGNSLNLTGQEGGDEYTKLADQLSARIWSRWEEHLLTNATGASVAIELEIAPVSERQRVADQLARLVLSVGGRISTGFLGTPLVMHALSEYGHFEAAYSLLFNEEIPGWLYQVKMGATSMWERWDAMRPDGSVYYIPLEMDEEGNGMLSLNHYAYGAVADWMFRHAAGIAPRVEQPGYRIIEFAPRPHKKLTSAKASIDTRFGLTSIEWKIVADQFTAEILIPSGAEGVFVDTSTGNERKLGSGKHSITLSNVRQ